MPLLSPALDLLLCLVCLVLAILSARARNDFLFAGYMWVAAAAFAGTFNLAGQTWTHATHTWLSQVARGPGMFALGVGILAAVYGPLPASRWLSPAVAIAGAGAIHLLSDSSHLESVATLLGTTLLIALLVLAFKAFRQHRVGPASAALMALVLLLAAGFGVSRIPLASDSAVRHVDLLHIDLIVCYVMIWLAVYGMSAVRTEPGGWPAA